ncbi:hypothetical protein [Gordonia aquimaris]|uniref:Uncharacterized protein n=1 Tax=Gordonia aquimaris TaxID=2984863 RepID=A0A9X3I476_9ACTN|nr:hypothetical protein [Gordonia aquimaris]MCX2963179.1 hypothetical protein [Gordonia aquimaris]
MVDTSVEGAGSAPATLVLLSAMTMAAHAAMAAAVLQPSRVEVSDT